MVCDGSVAGQRFFLDVILHPVAEGCGTYQQRLGIADAELPVGAGFVGELTQFAGR